MTRKYIINQYTDTGTMIQRGEYDSYAKAAEMIKKRGLGNVDVLVVNELGDLMFTLNADPAEQDRISEARS